MKLKLEQFETLNLYSNRSMEKIVSSLVNESANAVLVNLFEDSMILLDHTEGTFYTADYKFDRKDLVLEIKNFEEVELYGENASFKDDVEKFFEDEDTDYAPIVESYKTNVLQKDAFLKDLVAFSMSKKDFSDVVDYTQIKEAVDAIQLSSLDEEVVKFYKERLKTHPLKKINYFNFYEDVKVSLKDTETRKVVTESVKTKAMDFWKNEDFKKEFVKMAKVLKEDVEEGTELLKELVESYPAVLFLDKADRTTLFGKTMIGSKALREDTKEISKGINFIFESFDIADMKKEYLLEEEGEEEEEPAEAPVADAPKEVSEPESKKIVDDLKKIAEKIEDEKIKEKLDALITSIEKAPTEGTKPEDVKEAVEILTL